MKSSAVLVSATFMIALVINTYGVQADCNTDADPCGLSGIAGIPHMEHRSPNTTLTLELIDSKYCDLYALNEDTWYRSDYNMTNYCVIQQSCGADNPIWMQGEIPGVDEGIVTNTACVRSYTECCANTYSVKVKNCESFTVYCFVDTPTACHQRFCFDAINGLTTTTTTTTTQPASPATPPETTPPSTTPPLSTTPATTPPSTTPPSTTLQITTPPSTTPPTTQSTTPPSTTLQSAIPPSTKPPQQTPPAPTPPPTTPPLTRLQSAIPPSTTPPSTTLQSAIPPSTKPPQQTPPAPTPPPTTPPSTSPTTTPPLTTLQSAIPPSTKPPQQTPPAPTPPPTTPQSTPPTTTPPSTTLSSSTPVMTTMDQHGGRNVLKPQASCRNDGPSTPFVILITALGCTVVYTIIAVLANLVMRQYRMKSVYVLPDIMQKERKQNNGNVQTVREDPEPVLGDMSFYDMQHKK